MFSARLRWKSLAFVCRSLATLLESGVDLRRALAVAAGKSQDRKTRRAIEGVREAVDQGEDLTAALRSQQGAFPDLLIDMVQVAELSGALPEILRHLAEHYEDNLRLRKAFVGQIAWPAFQFVAATFIIAFVILVMGWVADVNQSEPIDVLGLGLMGADGALIWLTCVYGTLFVLFVTYQVLSRGLAGKAFVHRLVLSLPVVGNCARAFAVARFSWAYYLTQQTGMTVDKSLTASLRATNNGAFIAAGPRMLAQIEAGWSVHETFAASGLFPAEFLEMVHVGETSGTVPETLHRLSPQFEADARRSLSAMTSALGWLVWALVAGFIVFFVFSIAMWYVSILNDVAGGL